MTLWTPRGLTGADADVLDPSVGWTDLVILAAGVRAPGDRPAQYNDTESTMDFANGQDRRLDVSYQLPHTWLFGSEVRFHIHHFSSDTSAGNVRWEIRTRKISGQSVATTRPTWTTTYLTAAVAANEGPQVTDIIQVPMTGITENSAGVQFQLLRLGGDALDTHTGTIQVWSLDIHYQVFRATGSPTEYVG